MDNYYIIRVNEWYTSFVKGSEEEFRNFLSERNMLIVEEFECFKEDMPFIYRKGYRISLPVRGIDRDLVNGKLTDVLAITGRVDDYLESRIWEAIKRNVGETVFINSSLVTILRSDGEIPDGYVETYPGHWEKGFSFMTQRKHSSFSEHDDDYFWSNMLCHASLSKPE